MPRDAEKQPPAHRDQETNPKISKSRWHQDPRTHPTAPPQPQGPRVPSGGGFPRVTTKHDRVPRDEGGFPSSSITGSTVTGTLGPCRGVSFPTSPMGWDETASKAPPLRPFRGANKRPQRSQLPHSRPYPSSEKFAAPELFPRRQKPAWSLHSDQATCFLRQYPQGMRAGIPCSHCTR